MDHRAVPGAEVVDGEAHPGLGQFAQHLRLLGGDVDEGPLGDLDHQPLQAEARRLRASTQVLQQPGTPQLSGPEVDGDEARGPGRGQVTDRLGEHDATQRVDEPGLLGDLDELGGADESSVLLHAAQRLHPDDLAGAQVDDRVVCRKDAPLLPDGSLHPRGGLGHADAHLRSHRAEARQVDGGAELVDELLGGGDPVEGPLRVDEHAELVRPQTGDARASGQTEDGRLEPAPDDREQGVAHLVAVGVVDHLEPVQVEVEHGPPGPGTGRLAQPAQHRVPAVEPGQLVVRRPPGELGRALPHEQRELLLAPAGLLEVGLQEVHAQPLGEVAHP